MEVIIGRQVIGALTLGFMEGFAMAGDMAAEVMTEDDGKVVISDIILMLAT